MVHVRTSTPAGADQSPKPSNGLAGCFLELASGPGGIAVLVMVGVLILREHAWTITAKDAVYWCVVIAMAAVRFAKERRQVRETRDDPRRTLGPLVRFTATLLPLAGIGWVLAQSFRV